VSYPVVGEIPCFLTAAAGRQRIADTYDEIYRHHADVWVDQGRSDAFRSYFAGLARTLAPQRVLEVGCGEGALLAVLPGTSRLGVDPSVEALVRARARTAAQCAVARAEELPFADATFELVVSVGVMEHFEDPLAASSEIRRVLTDSGHYLALIHTDMTSTQRLALKARQFLWPRPRPLALLAWLIKKFHHPIVQPLRRSYSIEAARACLAAAGLSVERVITRRSDPAAPLAGDHVVILVARAATAER
jgi:SAM-dependent methyltransferase